jgi:hypothetical protein
MSTRRAEKGGIIVTSHAAGFEREFKGGQFIPENDEALRSAPIKKAKLKKLAATATTEKVDLIFVDVWLPQYSLGTDSVKIVMRNSEDKKNIFAESIGLQPQAKLNPALSSCNADSIKYAVDYAFNLGLSLGLPVFVSRKSRTDVMAVLEPYCQHLGIAIAD